MKTKGPKISERLNTCLKEREQIADELQNEINQTLASVLLWMQFTKKEHQLQEDKAFMQAEENLKIAIDRLRTLHYSLSRII
jgi:signal transduction histidine kinase